MGSNFNVKIPEICSFHQTELIQQNAQKFDWKIIRFENSSKMKIFLQTIHSSENIGCPPMKEFYEPKLFLNRKMPPVKSLLLVFSLFDCLWDYRFYPAYLMFAFAVQVQ